MIFDGSRTASDAPPMFVNGAIILFAVSMILLLLPKLWSVLLILQNRHRTQLHGGGLRLCVSAVLEIVASVLLSPIMAVYHSRFVVAILSGTSIRWNAQQRDETGVAWGESFRQFVWFTVGGIIAGALLWLAAPGLLLWFAPLIVGVVLSIPIAVAMGSRRVGLWLRRRGLLLVPAETEMPSVCKRHQAALPKNENTGDGSSALSLFDQLLSDPSVFARHLAVLRETDSHQDLTEAQASELASHVGSGTLDSLSAELRRAVLLDRNTLQEMHLQAQLKQLEASNTG